MLLAQAILPCENNFGQVPQTQNGSCRGPNIGVPNEVELITIEH